MVWTNIWAGWPLHYFYQVLSFLSTMCCISGDPVEDPSGRLKSKQTSQKFQVGMIDAPWVDGYKSWGW